MATRLFELYELDMVDYEAFAVVVDETGQARCRDGGYPSLIAETDLTTVLLALQGPSHRLVVSIEEITQATLDHRTTHGVDITPARLA